MYIYVCVDVHTCMDAECFSGLFPASWSVDSSERTVAMFQQNYIHHVQSVSVHTTQDEPGDDKWDSVGTLLLPPSRPSNPSFQVRLFPK